LVELELELEEVLSLVGHENTSNSWTGRRA